MWGGGKHEDRILMTEMSPLTGKSCYWKLRAIMLECSVWELILGVNVRDKLGVSCLGFPNPVTGLGLMFPFILSSLGERMSLSARLLLPSPHEEGVGK